VLCNLLLPYGCLKVTRWTHLFVHREIYVNESSVTYWAYVFMEGVHVCAQNIKRSNYVSRYGEVEDEDDDSPID
jgi:hypothetical protein